MILKNAEEILKGAIKDFEWTWNMDNEKTEFEIKKTIKKLYEDGDDHACIIMICSKKHGVFYQGQSICYSEDEIPDMFERLYSKILFELIKGGIFHSIETIKQI